MKELSGERFLLLTNSIIMTGKGKVQIEVYIRVDYRRSLMEWKCSTISNTSTYTNRKA